MAEYEVLTPIRTSRDEVAPVGSVITGDPEDPEVVEKLRCGAIRLMPGSAAPSEPGDTDPKAATKSKPAAKA